MSGSAASSKAVNGRVGENVHDPLRDLDGVWKRGVVSCIFPWKRPLVYLWEVDRGKCRLLNM